MIDVSIVIATYNAEATIERAIRSCLRQSMLTDEFEVIVVDDGSTDGTREIIENFTETWLRVIHLPENVGVGGARNEGIKKARGKFIVMVDSDDFISEYMIFIQRMYLEMNKGIAAVAVDYYEIDEEEDILRRVNCLDAPIACGVMYRKSKLIEVGLYKELRLHEEKELFFRFLDKFPTYRIALPLYRYYMREGSLTHQEGE